MTASEKKRIPPGDIAGALVGQDNALTLGNRHSGARITGMKQLTRKAPKTRKCECGCGITIKATREWKRFASPKCRLLAWARRQQSLE